MQRMKNKKLIYILIPLVMLVWGLIFYKIYLKIKGPADDDIKIYSVGKEIIVDNQVDTIKLMLYYRDPFLSYSFHLVSRRTPGFGSSLLNSDKKKKPDFIWPEIKYDGMIVNSKTKRKTGLINFEKSSLLVQEGDLVKGYKIVKLFADSVIISYSKNKKTFIH